MKYKLNILSALVCLNIQTLFANNSADSLSAKFEHILDWTTYRLAKPEEIRSIVSFKSDIYFASANGIFKINRQKHISELLVKGIDNSKAEKLRVDKLVVYEGQLYAAFLSNGIYRLSTDNLTWQPVRKGLTDSTFFDLTVCNGKLYAPSYNDGLFVLNKTNWSWEKIEAASAIYLIKCQCIDSVLWVGSQTNELFALAPQSNELKHIQQFGKPDIVDEQGDFAILGWGIMDIALYNNVLYISVHREGIFKSEDRGKTWYQSPIKFNASFLIPLDKYVVMGSAGNRKGLFITDDSGHLFSLTGINGTVIFACCIDSIFYLATREEGLYMLPCDEFEKFLENNKEK